MSVGKDKSEIVPSAPQSLSKYGSALVRRGLDDLCKSLHKQGPRVLIVDDEPLNVNYLDQFLSSHGYQVRSTCDAVKAIEIARNFQPDVAMVDVVMPEMDGIQVGMEISDFLPNTKIVLSITRCNEVPFDFEYFYHAAVVGLVRLIRSGYRFELFLRPFEKEDLLKRMKSWVDDTIREDSVTGFGLARGLNSVLDYWGDYDCEFSIVFFRVVEHWRQGVGGVSFRERRKLLAELAHGIKGCLKPGHLPFRYAKDKFALFPLPCRKREDFGEELAEKLSRLIHDTDWQETIGCPVKLSAKFAIVSFPEDGRTKEELLELGEKALSDEDTDESTAVHWDRV